MPLSMEGAAEAVALADKGVKLLSLDLSSSTGAAFGWTGLYEPRTVTWKLPSIGSAETHGKAFSALRRNLCDLHAVENFDAMIYESPLSTYAHTSGPARKSPDLAFGLLGLAAVADEWGETMGLDVFAGNVQTVRAFFVGSARPQDPKAHVMHRCRELGWKFDTNDAADALALWAYESHARDTAGIWTIGLKQRIKGVWNAG